MKFPCLLYKTPGPHRKPGVGTYRYIGCKDAEQYEVLKGRGWFPSLLAAMGKDEPVDETAPPTREEMEQKAKELGMRSVHLMKDETLAARIAEAIG